MGRRAHCPIREAPRRPGLLGEAERAAVWARADEEMDAAVRFAEQSPYPKPEDALADLFAVDTGYEY